jgi:hypothetical protein
LQLAHAPPSSLHWNVAPVSFALYVKLALVEATDPTGPLSMVVSGGEMSTLHAALAGVASTLPAASTARTLNTCGPCVFTKNETGLVHAAQSALSSVHWKTAPASDVNEMVALVVATVPLGAEVMVVSGATVSTVQVREAGVGSMLPATSFARTSNVCEPSASPENDDWKTHGANAAPSRRHSKNIAGDSVLV